VVLEVGQNVGYAIEEARLAPAAIFILHGAVRVLLAVSPQVHLHAVCWERESGRQVGRRKKGRPHGGVLGARRLLRRRGGFVRGCLSQKLDCIRKLLEPNVW
jgi:hypothetical protein